MQSSEIIGKWETTTDFKSLLLLRDDVVASCLQHEKLKVDVIHAGYEPWVTEYRNLRFYQERIEARVKHLEEKGYSVDTIHVEEKKD